ncbi:DUF4359 domain-containing protein [Synechococcus elongatus]|uniref:Uncharacterized protein n=1 Tax=Synechococcus elongatus (strain ATCC 33912 / PCC 7942 / FACHB-805) TaxID=1140 RepID=Q31KM2_SYNE7|nr:DUF4359 domain-containing protein [Synechococcus elongatus]ABB58397.1 conserved hypothetical protein [Synechococcus elongatus PCC 7942 = FACHB-805]AJD57139.1 hypothetical protein M744_04430 [Synechococcus elongatus UTEX 2973]MBD2587119.1 DUF4359 domain-containing protein [Synechococcus elongatus FACHB-242]MBD2688190.1 DUF4359 domain-containing protein [Synechococcus elongatus FACHB-1061]MBD2706099.1 DUF4359 domain-containing protein [Synechococcus elongatus PCC 7942 = FACHB-805]
MRGKLLEPPSAPVVSSQCSCWRCAWWLAGSSVALGAIALALTNPSSSQYGQFAAATSQKLVQQEICARLEPLNLQRLQQLCNRMGQQAGSQMEEWVLQSSDRQNFGLLSLYETRLSVRSLLQTSDVPDWSLELKSVGALSGFSLLQVNWKTDPEVRADPASEGKLRQ